ncbi:MAG: TonB-dependent receptor [bacterium]|nr:TonB-dependent receptor [bacterium]
MKHLQTGIARKFFFLMVGLLFSVGLNAQTITVSGVVSDPSGEPLIGASILAQGTTVGTSTNIDGEYTINVAPDATLVVSYVGYDTQNVPVDGRTSINVTMQENSVMLNEVVAIGYGTVKKSDATGSVAVIKPDEIEAGLATSVQDMLVGQTPGVVVTQAGGPEGGGTIRIRGGSSLNASNDPLIVVDGVPLSNAGMGGLGNSLGMISPENIESMTILKDASATAIYGSRASNGVIIITTKKGKSGKPTVNFAANLYVNTARKTWKVLDANQFRSLLESRGMDAALAATGDANTDWQDEVLRTTVSSDYSLSVGGTAGWLPYHAEISYTNNNGIIKTSKMDRVTMGFNLSPKFFDNHLSVNANVKGYYIRNNFGDAGALSSAISFDPTHPVRSNEPIVSGNSGFQYLYNGYYEVHNNGTLNDNAALNPMGLLEQRDNHANVYRSNGNLQLDYSLHFLPDLHLNLNLGYDVMKSNLVDNWAANSATAYKNHEHYGGAYNFDQYQFRSNTLLNFYLNYKKEVESIYSNFDVTAGYDWQRFYNDGHYTGANGNSGYRVSPGLNTPTYLGKNEAGQQTYGVTINESTIPLLGQNFQNDGVSPDGDYHWADRYQLLSFFGRLNYTFKDRYLLTVTVRGDATSRFAKDKRWGVFPAVALGWKINQEAWMQGAAGWLSDLKLRLGWGKTGQQEIGETINYMALYAIASPSVSYPNGTNGWYLPVYARGYNPDLTWETTTSWNAGLDFGFLNNRITGSIEYYKRKTTDLLAYVAVPAGSSTTNMLNRNIGSLENYGVEFNIAAKPIVTNDFTWTLSYNVGWNHNEITELTTGASQLKTGGISGGNGNTVQIHAEGHPASSFYLFQQVYDESGAPLEGVYVDQNGDGQIDDSDKIINKSPDPKVTMTFGSQFRYKKWDLGFNIRASIGNYVYNNVLSTKAVYNDLFTYGLNNVVENDYYFEQPRYMSDYYLRNASFVRCDNITLGYTWDNLLNDKLRLRLFGAVQNPFVITKYKGVDPEVFGGIDNSVYPRATTYSLGLVATF